MELCLLKLCSDISPQQELLGCFKAHSHSWNHLPLAGFFSQICSNFNSLSFGKTNLVRPLPGIQLLFSTLIIRSGNLRSSTDLGFSVFWIVRSEKPQILKPSRTNHFPVPILNQVLFSGFHLKWYMLIDFPHDLTFRNSFWRVGHQQRRRTCFSKN